MHDQSDVDLLRDYAERGNEAAFRELVERHTDFVYSAALRQVASPDIAGDLAQGVFTDLARKAEPLAQKMPGAHSLAGWLHRSTRYAALNHLRDTRRRLAKERQAMEQLLIHSESAPDWDRIRPVLDESLDSLDDADREALLLRYFKNLDFRAVGLALGVSDDTAQKRVSRAVERLREFFSKRRVTIGASGLAVVLSANAIEAAPAGLAASICSAALTGTAVTTSTILAATQTIAMTTLQKVLIAATLAIVAGSGIYEARQASQLREQNRALLRDQAPLAEQLRQARLERDAATNRAAALVEEFAKTKRSPSEVLKLRGEVGALRQEKAIEGGQSALNKLTANPETRNALRAQQKLAMAGVYAALQKRLNLTPDQAVQFNDLQADHVMDMIDLITQALHDNKTRGEVDQLMAAQNSALQEKLQALVGADGLVQYQEYTKDLAGTLTIDQFSGNLTGDATEVGDKKSRLLKAMQDATQSTLAAAGLPADYQIVPLLNFGNIASEDESSQSLQVLDGIYEQTAEKAAAFLGADELNKFQQFRTNAISSSRSLILMNRKLMAPIAQ